VAWRVFLKPCPDYAGDYSFIGGILGVGLSALITTCAALLHMSIRRSGESDGAFIGSVLFLLLALFLLLGGVTWAVESAQEEYRTDCLVW
jgi:hypothetical protein